MAQQGLARDPYAEAPVGPQRAVPLRLSCSPLCPTNLGRRARLASTPHRPEGLNRGPRDRKPGARPTRAREMLRRQRSLGKSIDGQTPIGELVLITRARSIFCFLPPTSAQELISWGRERLASARKEPQRSKHGQEKDKLRSTDVLRAAALVNLSARHESRDVSQVLRHLYCT